MTEDLESTLKRFAKARVLVVGDVMIDRYWWGSASRISPEAPVPVISLERMSSTLGGAANAAANVAGLGASASLIGVTGEDDEAELLPRILVDTGISSFRLVRLASRPTTIKTRIIAHHQQIARVDREKRQPITVGEAEAVLENIDLELQNCDAVILSDYAKGCLTDYLSASIISRAIAAGKPVLVDPKGKDYGKYRGATLLTPNLREAAEVCRMDEEDENLPEVAGRSLIHELDLQALLVTQGERGMTLVMRNGTASHVTAAERNVYDVTGAGDTVIATLAVALGSGMSLHDAAHIANLAAGLVVEHIGTTAISKGLLLNSYHQTIR